MRQAFLIVVVALWAAPVRGQFSTPYLTYYGQNRSVSAHASAGYLFTNVTNEETITAPDFQAFNQNLGEVSNSGASATAAATQNSLFGFALSATGGANATANAPTATYGANGSASSSFQTTFSFPIGTPAETLSVQLAAHESGIYSQFSYAYATFTLSGGLTNITLATSILPNSNQHDSVVTLPPTQLTGNVGQLYTISVVAGAYRADAGDILTLYGGPGNASYSFSLTPVPEPSSIALLLIGTAVLIARAKPIRYRVFG
jgi:hypothetical protein